MTGKRVYRVFSEGEEIGEIRKTPLGQYDARDFGAHVHTFRRTLENAQAFFLYEVQYRQVTFK